MAAAVEAFLEENLLSRSSTGQQPPYAPALKSDMRRLLEVHFKDLRGVLPASPTNEPATASHAVANTAPMKSYRI